jgi:hypothetical protein
MAAVVGTPLSESAKAASRKPLPWQSLKAQSVRGVPGATVKIGDE